MYQPPCSHDHSIPIVVFLWLRTVLNPKFYVCGRWQTTTLPLLLLASSSGVDFSICFYLDWTCELLGQRECGRSDCAGSDPGSQDLEASVPAFWEPCCHVDKPELASWRMNNTRSRDKQSR